MRHQSWAVVIVAITCTLLASSTIAQAGIETWISGNGADSSTCPITAPCRTFAFAHAQTQTGGTINVLSSGNFGPVTITKSISIVAQGVEAIVNTATAGAAITIQAPASHIVSLRGLTVDLGGAAAIGISFVSGAALNVHNSTIRRASDGIRFAPAAGTRSLYLADTVISDTTGNGIVIAPSGSAGARAVLDRVRIEKSLGDGISIQGNATTNKVFATVRDSVVSASGGTGISVNEDGGGKTDVMIDRTAVVDNSTGILASGTGATIRIGDSIVSKNTFGLATGGVSPGVIKSYGSNQVTGNGSDGVPTNVIGYK